MNVLKSLFIISVITMLSRMLGFIRDILIARIFGIGMVTDAFFIAFKLPNFLRKIFAEGAFSQAFIPILVEYKERKENLVTRTFIACISGLLILLLVIVVLFGCFAAPWLVSIFAPGFIDIQEKFVLATNLVRVIFPYIFFISLSSLISSILNTWNNFFLPALTPMLLNISMITFAVCANFWFQPPIMALAWSVILGGILQLICQLPSLNKIGMLTIPHLDFFDVGVLRVLKSMGIAVLAVSSNQISLIINTVFSSFLVSGSISWMYYAERLMELPTGIFGISLSTILLPLLSRSFSDKNFYEYSCLIDWGLRVCFILSLPSAVLLCVLAKPLVTVLFRHGGFSTYDVLMTQYALIAYSIGLVSLILVKVLSSAFYSSYNIKSTVHVAFIVLVVTQCMNIIFIGPLKHVGLSLAIGLGACCHAGLLYWQLRKRRLFYPRPGWLKFFFQIFLALGMMLLVLVILCLIFIDWMYGSTLYKFVRLIGVILISIITYFVTLWLVGVRLKDFIRPILLSWIKNK
ncbi:murein biosynthesis integral membrane protein MurJ [Blochmannia endosymbiont of Camponotus (Colobopsis) obliquus]|uniref:murein biosynthesis integral membrane protein MurJ n=1 Tax=Blochmannia endosymbiont of Camponotus (Colobopsis) obliquus TaxID=1505597 RepID=UPI00061A7B51|nr:murein biosynthesis integral membrane protein MurJ [Blochmannia endosymbiont of Camponotus (Colobopsis) obliquus]AKC60609.1 putative peptidoglycan biosynthesis protein MurJ [Blochmannia endosymbiont of Camponotus (Colobopsis) obliquus]